MESTRAFSSGEQVGDPDGARGGCLPLCGFLTFFSGFQVFFPRNFERNVKSLLVLLINEFIFPPPHPKPLKEAEVKGQTHKSRHTCSGLFLRPDLSRSPGPRVRSVLQTLMGRCGPLIRRHRPTSQKEAEHDGMNEGSRRKTPSSDLVSLRCLWIH